MKSSLFVFLFAAMIFAAAKSMVLTSSVQNAGSFLSRVGLHYRRPISHRQTSLMMSTAKDAALKAINENDVMVFSKTYCPYCTEAKGALSKLGIKFGVMELDKMKEGGDIQTELLALTGQKTVPNIFVKKTHIGGCDSTLAKIKSGELQKMLQ